MLKLAKLSCVSSSEVDTQYICIVLTTDYINIKKIKKTEINLGHQSVHSWMYYLMTKDKNKNSTVCSEMNKIFDVYYSIQNIGQNTIYANYQISSLLLYEKQRQLLEKWFLWIL